MSNLWFFRLKQVEQQRRRSSGEQSAGSASVKSASSLPAVSRSPSYSACQPFESEYCVANGDEPAEDNHQQQQRQQQQQQQRKLVGADGEWRRASRPLASDSDIWLQQQEQQQQQQQLRPLPAVRNSLSSISEFKCQYKSEEGEEVGEANCFQHHQQQQASAGKLIEKEVPLVARRDETESSLHSDQCKRQAGSRAKSWSSERQHCVLGDERLLGRESINNTMLASMVAPGGYDTGAQTDGPAHSARAHPSPSQSQSSSSHPLPQVTIIRSDSTYSFIPLVHGAPTANRAAESACTATNGKPLVAQLDSAGSIRSSCGEAHFPPLELPPPPPPPSGAAGSAPSAAQPATAKQQALTKVELKRGLHDQLASGKVPPIQDRRLLNPTGSGNAAGLSLADSMDNLASLIPRVRVEFYNSENTLKEQLQMYFIKDHTVSLYVRTAKLILKVLACYLYVCRVILDRGPSQAACYGCQSKAQMNLTSDSTSQQQTLSKFDSHPYDGPINFRALLWVDRGIVIWNMQTTIAVICFLEAILMQYLTYKNSIFSIVSFHFTLELITNTPFIISIFWKELRTLFVPGFLNCWLAKQCLEAMLNDLSISRQSSVFSHRLTILSATVFCLIFTSACGFQHTQRSGGRNYITIFESIYFVVVTFSTVGYGDFKPETWPSQLFIMVMLCVALIVLPTQFEQLAYFWIERKKLGASYAHHSTRHEKHVVVCSTTLRADTIMDFLDEFYAHPLLQTFSVVLLSPCELDTTMKLVLQTPTWNNRVVYIQGSALKAGDLIRARMQSAEACFILAARNYNDRSAADEHTILRSWAIRDFSPYVPQYVQIFRTENKIHVAFAEHVVCDDEFKYALLANNCLIPGISTLVTLLLHTSQHQSRRLRRRGRRGHGLFGAFGCSRSGNRRKVSSSQAADQSSAAAAAAATGNSQANTGSGQQQQQQFSSDDENGEAGGAEWKRLYGKCSANEIYHIRLSDSRFFGEYQGKSFTYASFHSHRKFGVALIGVQTDMRGTWPIMLNPGPSYVLKSGDTLFYINITKEENSTLMPMMHQEKRFQHFPSLSKEIPQVPPVVAESHPVGLDRQPGSQAADRPMAAAAAATTNDDQLKQQQVAGDVAMAAGLTSIRVEASSPTVPAGDLQPCSIQVAEERGESGEQQQLLGRGLNLPPGRHSVADGAGIVARSLCSMAGIVSAELAISDYDDELTSGCGDDQASRKGSDPRRYLATTLLSKRNSTASASAAIGHSHPQSGGCGGGNGGAGGGGLRSRNASTLELAALATGLRKGSNMSITSAKSRDVSPTRLKQVVSGLAVKMKRVKLGKSLTHLTIPRMDYGGSSTSSTESFVNARGRRPSIAPVPAMMGESEEHDSDHEREQESYFAMSWQSASESSPIVKKFVFCTTYVGVSPTLCYMLQRKKPSCCLQLISACEHCPFKNARQYNWSNRCIILASDFASNGIYNFLVPLRAHFHNPSELRPIVLLLERKPSPQFIDAISWFPMVYWMPGSIDSLDDLIKAGINLAHSVVVTNKESTNSAEEDYLADCNTIVAVQTMFKMFPSVGIITELSQSSNMRFMQFRAHDVLFGGLSMANYYYQPPPQQQQQFHLSESELNDLDGHHQMHGHHGSESIAGSNAAQSNAIRDRIQLRKLHSQYYNKTMGKDVNSHAYKYRLPFAAGNVFSASMLDTLLYQAFVKDYMITMVRLLLGIDQAPGSGFLSSMRITGEDLWIRTYGRLYQRLCSTTCEIPLGIYRTEPLETQRHESMSFGAFASQQASYEHATEELERIEITNMVKNRLQDLGMLVSDYDDSPANRNNTFSYVIINPNCDISLREGDIIYLIRPSPIHSRKLFINRASSVRHSDEPAKQPTKAVPPGGGGVLRNRFPQASDKGATISSGLNCRTKGSAAATACAKPSGGQSKKADGCRAAEDETDRDNLAHIQQSPPVPPLSRAQVGSSEQQQQVYMKSCLSDGDFHEILIKVSDQEDQDAGTNDNKMNSEGSNNCPADEKSRRRSSCSDADEPKGQH